MHASTGMPIAEPGDHLRQPAVVGPEVVAPVGDAVRLVDHHQAGPTADEGHHLVGELGVGQPFGRHQHEVDRVVGQPLRRARWTVVSDDELIVIVRSPSRYAASIWLRMSASNGEISSVGPRTRLRSRWVARK